MLPHCAQIDGFDRVHQLCFSCRWFTSRTRLLGLRSSLKCYLFLFIDNTCFLYNKIHLGLVFYSPVQFWDEEVISSCASPHQCSQTYDSDCSDWGPRKLEIHLIGLLWNFITVILRSGANLAVDVLIIKIFCRGFFRLFLKTVFLVHCGRPLLQQTKFVNLLWYLYDSIWRANHPWNLN